MKTIGFIGLGLIGGSLARSIRRTQPSWRLMAYSHSRSTLDEAISAGAIDLACEQDDQRFGECDVIILCAPVRTNITYLPFLKEVINDSCVITDVGSVKGEMAEAVRKEGLAARFVGGHPMAGSEKTGFSNSTDYLLENAYYFLTPTAENSEKDIKTCLEIVAAARALPVVISPEQHDFIVAGVSHLPHIVASALVNTVRGLDDSEEHMRTVAAGGFRDITRIASSSPVMWEQICLSNGRAISRVLEEYIGMLQQAKKYVDNGDGQSIHDMFTSSRNYRDSIDDRKRGSVSRHYDLYVDIYDEAGGIATITTLLAMNAINIKNIGIIHNREFEEGVLRIEFYDGESRNSSEEILQKRNYIIRKKK